MALLGRFTMQPRDAFDFDLDYSRWLTATDDIHETTPPEVTIYADGAMDADDLQVDQIHRTDNKRVKVWLSKGKDGRRYKVEVTTTTREGRVKEDEFFITVRDY